MKKNCQKLLSFIVFFYFIKINQQIFVEEWYIGHSFNDFNYIITQIEKGVQFFKIDLNYIEASRCIQYGLWVDSLLTENKENIDQQTENFKINNVQMGCLAIQGDVSNAPFIDKPFNNQQSLLQFIERIGNKYKKRILYFELQILFREYNDYPEFLLDFLISLIKLNKIQTNFIFWDQACFKLRFKDILLNDEKSKQYRQYIDKLEYIVKEDIFECEFFNGYQGIMISDQSPQALKDYLKGIKYFFNISYKDIEEQCSLYELNLKKDSLNFKEFKMSPVVQYWQINGLENFKKIDQRLQEKCPLVELRNSIVTTNIDLEQYIFIKKLLKNGVEKYQINYSSYVENQLEVIKASKNLELYLMDQQLYSRVLDKERNNLKALNWNLNKIFQIKNSIFAIDNDYKLLQINLNKKTNEVSLQQIQNIKLNKDSFQYFYNIDQANMTFNYVEIELIEKDLSIKIDLIKQSDNKIISLQSSSLKVQIQNLPTVKHQIVFNSQKLQGVFIWFTEQILNTDMIKSTVYFYKANKEGNISLKYNQTFFGKLRQIDCRQDINCYFIFSNVPLNIGNQFINNGMSDFWFDNDKANVADNKSPICEHQMIYYQGWIKDIFLHLRQFPYNIFLNVKLKDSIIFGVIGLANQAHIIPLQGKSYQVYFQTVQPDKQDTFCHYLTDTYRFNNTNIYAMNLTHKVIET